MPRKNFLNFTKIMFRKSINKKSAWWWMKPHSWERKTHNFIVAVFQREILVPNTCTHLHNSKCKAISLSLKCQNI